MSWSRSLTGLFLLAVTTAVSYSQTADDALWREFGLTAKSTAKLGPTVATVYRMKDSTGAIAAWEWQREPGARPCTLEAFCSNDGKQFVVASANYVVAADGPVTKPVLDAFLKSLPNWRDTSLPPIFTYIPHKNLVPNSARYVLGSESLRSFALPLAAIQPGFEQGVEAQVADYKMRAADPTLHLALFYYPTPEMARMHLARFKQLPGVHVKRSRVLVALVFGGASDEQADSLLNLIEYEAKVTWSDIPPPSPIKPLYQLLWNIIYMSVVLVALCLVSGLVYAGIRLYRRRFGTLEDDEAMTTLHLSGR